MKWTPDGAHLIFSDVTLIRIVDAEGSRLRTIVDASPFKPLFRERFPYGFHADVSPDGSRIVYSSCKPRGRSPTGRQLYNYEIATIAIDGTDPQRLTYNGYYDHFPAWSPDGTRIAFIANPSSSDPGQSLPQGVQLFTMAADGSDVRLLTPSIDSVGLYPPVWSPDGGSLAFLVNERDGGTLRRILYAVRSDGTGLSRIAATTGMPAWPPDSEQIAFVASDGEEVSVNVARPDGSGPREVLRGFGGPVAWSPDGSELFASRAVTARRLPGQDALVWEGIYAVRPDGSGQRLLVPSYLSDLIDVRDVTHRLAGLTAWSPDGSRIAFYDLDGLLVTAAQDGTDLRGVVRSDPDFTNLNETLKLLNERLSPWYAPGPDVPVDPEACSAGSIVREPGAHQGLVMDCRTLLSIRDMLAGGADLDWSEQKPISEWQGVSVDGSPLRVHRLDLVGLTGTLPPELGRLTALRYLSVEGKGHEFKLGGLTGAVPPELGSLKELEDLHLSRNYLSGVIPPDLGGLESLRSLHLDENLLSGSIPPELSNLKLLEDLGLEGNNLSGCVPTELPEVWVQQNGLKRCGP